MGGKSMKFFKKPIVKKIGVIVIIAVIVLGGLVVYRRYSSSKAKPAFTTMEYTIKKGSIQSSISAIGTIYASDSRTITGSNGSTVVSVNCTEGQQVKSGDVLFTLKNDSAQIDLKKSKLNLSQLQAQLNTLKTQQSELTINAPISGVIKDVSVQTGDDINKQGIVATVEDTSVMKFSVSSSSAGPDSSLLSALKTGDTVSIYIPEINATRSATVTSISSDSRGAGAVIQFKLSDKSGLNFESSYTVTFKFSAKDVTVNAVPFTGDMANITAKQSGTVTGVYINPGDTVAKGKKIIDTKSDSITNSIQTTQVNIESAQLDVTNKQSVIDALTVKAPIDGMVFNIQAAVGDVVGTTSSSSSSSRTSTTASSSSSGNTLASLENKSALQVNISVDELDIGKVQIGQDVNIAVDAFKDKTFKGKVSYIAPTGTVSSGVASFPVRVDVENSDGLKTGMTSNVTIIVSSKENAVLVPLEAVIDSRGKKYVRVKEGDTVTQKEVTLGLVNTDSAEVVSGLNEGDKIVIQFQNSSGTTTNNRAGFSGMGGIMGGSGNNGGFNRSTQSGNSQRTNTQGGNSQRGQ
jgi:Membrane-fusion protein